MQSLILISARHVLFGRRISVKETVNFAGIDQISLWRKTNAADLMDDR